MKKLLLVFIMIPTMSFAQKSTGFASLQSGMLVNKNLSNKVCINGAVGMAVTKYAGIGMSVDVYPFQKNNLYWVPKADLRMYFKPLSDEVPFFLSFQPGYSIKKGNNLKGAFSFDAYAGLMGRPKNKIPGVILMAGYGEVAFTLYQRRSAFKGFKFTAGLSF